MIRTAQKVLGGMLGASGLVFCLATHLIFCLATHAAPPSVVASKHCDLSLNELAEIRQAARQSGAPFEKAFAGFEALDLGEESQSLQRALVAELNLLFEGRENSRLSQQIRDLTKDLKARPFAADLNPKFNFRSVFPSLSLISATAVKTEFLPRATPAQIAHYSFILEQYVLGYFFKNFHGIQNQSTDSNLSVVIGQALSDGDFSHAIESFNIYLVGSANILQNIFTQIYRYGINFGIPSLPQQAKAARSLVTFFYWEFPLRFYNMPLAKPARTPSSPTDAASSINSVSPTNGVSSAQVAAPSLLQSDLDHLRALRSQVDFSYKVQSALQQLVRDFIDRTSQEIRSLHSRTVRSSAPLPVILYPQKDLWNQQLLNAAKKYLQAVVVLDYIQLRPRRDGTLARGLRMPEVELSDLKELKNLFCGQASSRVYDELESMVKNSDDAELRYAAYDYGALNNIHRNQKIFDELIAQIAVTP